MVPLLCKAGYPVLGLTCGFSTNDPCLGLLLKEVDLSLAASLYLLTNSIALFGLPSLPMVDVTPFRRV